MSNLTPISRLSDGVEQIKIFLKSEERELVKQVCRSEGISMTHLARQLLIAWASQQQEDESA
jgi:hypothetical protein